MGLARAMAADRNPDGAKEDWAPGVALNSPSSL